MRQAIVAAAIFALLLGPVPALARTALEPLAAEEAGPLYGIAIFTSDGVKIGTVTDTGTDEDGSTVLLAEIGQPLSIGTETVAIPLDLVALRDNRIDLSLTATEVSDILASARRNRNSDI